MREGRAREGSRRWFPSELCPVVVLRPLARCSEQVPAQHHHAQVQAPTTLITHCPGCGWAAPLGGHSSGTVWGSRRPGDFTLLVLFKVQRGYQLAALRRYRFFRHIINAQKTFALPQTPCSYTQRLQGPDQRRGRHPLPPSGTDCWGFTRHS